MMPGSSDSKVELIHIGLGQPVVVAFCTLIDDHLSKCEVHIDPRLNCVEIEISLAPKVFEPDARGDDCAPGKKLL